MLGLAKHITSSKILQDTKYSKLLDEKVLSYKTYQKGLLVHALCVNTLQQDSKAEIHVKIKNNEVGNCYKVTWFVDGTFPLFTPSLSSADKTFSLFCWNFPSHPKSLLEEKGLCSSLPSLRKNNQETFCSSSPQWGSCVMPLQQFHELPLLRLQGF